ncbi:methyltransferase domain-containing protein [Flaviaesturariibacter flavus]|uniref:Methyltransferase domain-containing protein n=1 Tax=Flaviaesturariibacter flavus TaxID=2502780 RepID=A0A4V2NVF9_9BACT|nr:methyltransferase domain-containing protein [Flaviaesturariibacter flavus]TCJ13356.1 methyltransferase domain-containing protein [Flaviaesturariibacter flavus]
MPSLRTRTYEKELLDRDDIPFADIAQNMRELDVINTRLGGHVITTSGLRTLLGDERPTRPVRVLEIGCGGGDNLRAIGRWARREGVAVALTGVDINPECIAFARQRPGSAGIHFIESDYRTLQPEAAYDIVFSSLFCHHFTDAELVEQLRWMHARAVRGFFINDLHRHPLAYHAIRLLTRAFSRSYLVRNDAPLSVRRGFQRVEWTSLLEKAGIRNYQCRWRWAFRWLIIAPHE